MLMPFITQARVADGCFLVDMRGRVARYQFCFGSLFLGHMFVSVFGCNDKIFSPDQVYTSLIC